MKTLFCYLILLPIFIFASCEDRPTGESDDPDTDVIVNIFPDTLIQQESLDPGISYSDFDAISEGIDGESPGHEAYESEGFVYAKFIGAGMVEGDVSLEFVTEVGEKMIFWYNDIDNEKENLYTVKTIKDSFPPEFHTNPEIEDIFFKLYWKMELRETLAGKELVKVLKKIER